MSQAIRHHVEQLIGWLAGIEGDCCLGRSQALLSRWRGTELCISCFVQFITIIIISFIFCAIKWSLSQPTSIYFLFLSNSLPHPTGRVCVSECGAELPAVLNHNKMSCRNNFLYLVKELCHAYRRQLTLCFPSCLL